MTRVAVIGPGRVGTTLALALPAPAYRVVAVAGRGRPALETFAARLPGALVDSPEAAARRADLVLVCVPDDALAGVVRAVARADGVRQGSRWVHVSGGAGTEVLRPARLAGAAVAACHPAHTFPEPDAALTGLPGTAWAVTAAPPDLPWARRLVTDLGGRPVAVDERARALYHAGLALGSNATAAVVTLARELLLGAGIAQPEAFLSPLAEASVRGAAARGAAALTGPVRRGDAGTVARHLVELAQVMPEALEPYLALSRLALRHARLAGLDPQAARAVADTLAAAEQQRGEQR